MSQFRLSFYYFLGLSVIIALAGCGGASGNSAQSTLPIAVSVNPGSATLIGGATQTFVATVSNDSANAGVAWQASTGSITAAGVYTAPSPVTTASATLTATSKSDPSKSATATITLTPIAITLSSSGIALTGDGVQTATIGASITGDSSASGATFVVSGAGGMMSANPVSGNSPSSVYTSPVVSAAASSVITVASVADPTKSQTVAVTLNPPMSFTTAPGALAAGIAGAVYPGATIAVAGGTGAKTFSVAGGSLPAGLTLSASGAVSGTPTGPLVTSSFTVKVTDQSAAPSQLTAGFSIVVGAPQLTSVSPSSVAIGTTSTTVTLTGVGFGPATTVYVGAYSTPTTYISPQSVSFVLPPQSYIGSYNVNVRNASYNSNVLYLSLVNPVPTLTSISPTTVIAGSPGFSLTLTGSGISAASTVMVNGAAYTISYGSGTTASVTVPATQVATLGNLSVTVVNPTPGGGTSAAQQLQVIGADNRLRTLNYATVDIVTDPVRTMLYASLNGANSVVAIDPLQGTVVTTQAMPSQPGQLAVSDDGSYLYVSLPSTGQVSRLLLPSLAPDITISLGYSALDLEIAPGHPHTIAATGVPEGVETNSVAIFDDGVERSLIPSASYATRSFDTVAWGSDATTLYATTFESSGGNEYIFSVNQNGPTLSTTNPSTFDWYVKRLIFNKTTGLLYDGYGNAVSPPTGSTAGVFTVQNTISYEPNPFAIDSVHGRAFFLNENSTIIGGLGFTEDIQAFDLNKYSFLNSILIPNLSGSKIVSWGASGLAVGGGNQIYLLDGSFVSSSGVSSPIGSYVTEAPTLTSATPQSVEAGSVDTTVTLTGLNFSQAAQVTWNGQKIPFTWQSSTQGTATIPAALLTQAVSASIYISNGPGTENSAGVPFAVLADLGANVQIAALGVSGEDMVWDSTRNLLYVAVTNPAVANGNSIAVVDPAIPALQNVVFTGNQPAALGISDDGLYLYSGFQTLASVKRYTLPSLSLALTIPLNFAYTGENYANDVKVAPGQNQTIAVSTGNRVISPPDAGGVAIFDNAIQRSKAPGYFDSVEVYKLSWGNDATRLYGHAYQGGETLLGIDGTGIASRTSVGGGLGYTSGRPHYDAGTNLVYSDGGHISNATDDTPAGVFEANGLMVPDSKLNRAFFVVQDPAKSTGFYDLKIFNLTTQTLLETIPIGSIIGYPTQFVRWGTQGLALLTDNYTAGPGMLYILQGSDISGLSTPPPGAITLSPAGVLVGSATGTTITVTGTNFVAGSTVLVNGSARATTFVSATQLTFQLTFADQASANYLSVAVTTPGGITTPTTSLAVNNPAPSIASLGSPNVLVGSYDLITIQGTGFIPTTVAQLNGSPRTTTYVSSTQVAATPSYSDFVTPGKYSVTVVNPAPGGGVSGAATLEVDNPAPVITGLSVSTIATGSPAQKINVYGSGFISATVVQIGGTARTTTYSTSAQMSVQLTAADLATSGTLSLVAISPSPGGGTSATASISVNNGIPGPITLSPNTVLAGTSTPTTITVSGSNFLTGCVVQVNASNRATTFVSSTQLTFVLTVADQAAVANKSVTVVNPSPGGTSSALLTISASSVTPVITSVSPTQFVLGSGSSSMQVLGSGFTQSSTVSWNGIALSSSDFNAQYLSALVPASLLTNAGTATITVTNPTASPSLSNAVSVSIVNPPAPVLTSISPSSGPINTAFTETLTGTGFTGSSIVSVNGTALPTTFVSSTQVTAAVPANLIPPGNLSFTVATPAPGGGTSTAVIFTAYIPIVNNSMIYNSTNGLFYLSVPSSAGAPYANSVVSLDPVTGALGTPIFVGSEPNRLALTSDGRYLWVGLDGAHAVRKLDLVAGSAGLQFSIPPYTSTFSNAAFTAFALAAIPGQSDSVIVSAGASQFAYSTITIYDSGAPRANAITLFTSGIYSVQVDGSRSEAYAAASAFDPYTTYTYNVSGLFPKISIGTSTFVGSNQDRIQLVSGRVYTDYRTVYDAESGTLLGTFSTPANYSSYTDPAAIDSTLGLAFLLEGSVPYSQLNQIQPFKLSDFSQYGTAIPFNLATNNSGQPVGYPFGLTRWGTNGLAFDTGVSVYALRSNLVKDLSATAADLGVTIAASGPNTTGTQTTYTATISNSGPSIATEVSLSVSLPSTGVPVSATPSSGSCSTGSAVTCDLGTLNSGGTATVSLTVNQLTAGSAITTAEVSASQADPNIANNQATSTVTITGTAYAPVPVLLSIAPSAIVSGSTDTTITVAGTGFGAGTTVQLDGATLQTSLLSASQLSATVPAASLATLGWHAITVSNPSPGGGVSTAQPLTVYSVLKAGVNHILYEPFSRQIFATMGSTLPQGNSVETLTPSTGVFSTPVYVGSEPTRMTLSDDGQILYVLDTGSSQIVRYNTLTQQSQFGFAINNSAVNFSVQPGTENTLAITGANSPEIEIVDVDPVGRTAAARPSNSGNNLGSTPQFLDASDLVVGGAPAQQLALYSVTSTGIGTAPSSYVPGGLGPFKLMQGVSYSTSGSVSNVASRPGRLLGTLPFNVNSSYAEAALAPDPAIGRVFFLAGTGTNYSSNSLSGVVAFDTNTFLPAAYIPLDIAAIETSSTPTPVDVVRWGQDGVAALTGAGNIYLLRGGAVLPQLLQTNTPPVLGSNSPASVGHGSGNTVLTISGSNFLPGVAASWNGSYRTTNFVSASQVTVDIPAADLTSPGTASITAANPGSASSASILIPII